MGLVSEGGWGVLAHDVDALHAGTHLSGTPFALHRPLACWLMLQAGGNKQQGAREEEWLSRRTFWPSIRSFKAAAGTNGGCAIRPSENLCTHRIRMRSMECAGCLPNSA